MLTDDAPQFKKLVEELALFWIHEGRHYNRLAPVVPCSVDALKDLKTRFWDFYGDLLKYKQNPSPETAAKLSFEFDELFSTKTIYDALNDRIEKTRNKKDELLLVLKYPWLPLHNNDSEHAYPISTGSSDSTGSRDQRLDHRIGIRFALRTTEYVPDEGRRPSHQGKILKLKHSPRII